jgi:single-stranded DNA-binding protein
MNKVFLTGYLGQDPDFREFEPRENSSGSSLAKISVAVYDARNSKDSYFIPCVA